MNGFPSFIERTDQNLNCLRVKNPIRPERGDKFKHRGAAPAAGLIAPNITPHRPESPKAKTVCRNWRVCWRDLKGRGYCGGRVGLICAHCFVNANATRAEDHYVHQPARYRDVLVEIEHVGPFIAEFPQYMAIADATRVDYYKNVLSNPNLFPYINRTSIERYGPDLDMSDTQNFVLFWS